ncbi:MAG: hypothetical protein AAGK02_12575 [Pseudomonadota bacterium]
MARAGAIKKAVCARVYRWRKTKRPLSEAPIADVALIMQAIHHRHRAGKTTSLRQLHKIANVPQPEALRLARRMEREGVAFIERNSVDAFESHIALSEATHRQLDRVVGSD